MRNHFNSRQPKRLEKATFGWPFLYQQSYIAFFSQALMLPDNLSQALLRNFTTYANLKTR